MWQANRRFALKVLRDFGLGKSTLENTIDIEIEHFLKLLEDNVEKPFKLDYALNVAALNVVWGMVAGN